MNSVTAEVSSVFQEFDLDTKLQKFRRTNFEFQNQFGFKYKLCSLKFTPRLLDQTSGFGALRSLGLGLILILVQEDLVVNPTEISKWLYFFGLNQDLEEKISNGYNELAGEMN